MNPLLLANAGRWLLARAPWVIAAVVLGVVLAMFVHRGRVIVDLRAELFAVREAAAKAEAAAIRRAREQEAEWQANWQALEEDHAKRTAALAASVDAARADGERLRGTLADFARRSSGASGAPCAPDDTTLLAGLLGELDRLAEASARAADERAEQVKALQDWIEATR